jgi:hypothetical protein
VYCCCSNREELTTQHAAASVWLSFRVGAVVSAHRTYENDKRTKGEETDITCHFFSSPWWKI